MAFRGLLLSALLAVGCAAVPRFPLQAPLTHDTDQQLLPAAPEEYYSPFAWDGANYMLFHPLARFCDERSQVAPAHVGGDEGASFAIFAGNLIRAGGEFERRDFAQRHEGRQRIFHGLAGQTVGGWQDISGMVVERRHRHRQDRDPPVDRRTALRLRRAGLPGRHDPIGSLLRNPAPKSPAGSAGTRLGREIGRSLFGTARRRR